jgi:predicted transcriptional regulator
MDENQTLEEIYYKADGYALYPVKINEIVKAKKLNERNFVVITNGLISKGKLRKIDFGVVSITPNGLTEIESRLESEFVTRKKEERKKFLQELLSRSSGDTSAKFEYKEIGNAIGLDEEKSMSVVEILSHKGLVENVSGSISITNDGIKLLQAN